MGFKNNDKTVGIFDNPQCNDAPLGRLPVITDKAAFDYMLHLTREFDLAKGLTGKSGKVARFRIERLGQDLDGDGHVPDQGEHVRRD